MAKLRYISPDGASNKVAAQAKRQIPKLGKLLRVAGIRVLTTRSYRGDGGEKRSYTTTHEYVKVWGENGYARFEGVCWGYGGSGPHALKDVLVQCGLPADVAWKIASTSPRNDRPGNAPYFGKDWEYFFASRLYRTWNVTVAVQERDLFAEVTPAGAPLGNDHTCPTCGHHEAQCSGMGPCATPTEPTALLVTGE